ncbi:putative cyclic nucleotide-gated ion channel 18-like protein [Corchorus olitorius]|uniref:Cyclic nucleotide-gated ion channel 18-like protein n=1 Tax=Corchorus olitorius TaxID=93759 RepID=A0A1R3G7A8_9ROSI|nr:putative cyclic nucleotide-gated ion channel 18-like protein [Corchorus olitorius]
MNSIIPSFHHLPTSSVGAIVVPSRVYDITVRVQYLVLPSKVNTPTDYLLLWRYQILDPDTDIVFYWNPVFLIVIPVTRNSRADHANNIVALIVLLQYVPSVKMSKLFKPDEPDFSIVHEDV